MSAKIKTGKHSALVSSVKDETPSDLFRLLDALKDFPEFRSDIPRLAALDSLCAELQKPNANIGVIKYYWSAIRAATITGGAVDILDRVWTELRFDNGQ